MTDEQKQEAFEKPKCEVGGDCRLANDGKPKLAHWGVIYEQREAILCCDECKGGVLQDSGVLAVFELRHG
jgi:hypothetical protein